MFLGSCAGGFSSNERVMSRGGSYQPGKTTIDQCKSACLQDAQCLATDFNTALRRCFIHHDGYLDNLVTPVDDVTQYRRTGCSGSECDTHVVCGLLAYI